MRWIALAHSLVAQRARGAIACGVMVAALIGGTYCQTSRSPATSEIVTEALRLNNSDVGRPLPLAGHWNSGLLANGFSPDYQMRLIAQGHYLFQWFNMPDIGEPLSPKWISYYEAPLKQAASLGLPIAFISTQWESPLTKDQAYASLRPDANPNVVDVNGRVKPVLSPFGPVGLWQDIGNKWTSSPLMRKLQEWYPDPPLVLFISNNEQSKLRWKDVETSAQYLKMYGTGRSDGFKRKVISDGWIARYHALQTGMLNGLISPQWKRNARFIGYNAYGPSYFGRWPGWKEYSSYIPGRMDANPLYWDGTSSPFYVFNETDETDYTVWSPQVEAMNWLFMLNETYRINPNFWFEMSTWDGGASKRAVYANRGQTFNPDRYGGMVQFGMWLLKPRVVREYRDYNDTLANSEAYFLQVVKAVDNVHNNPVLRGFWQKGQLVANHAHPHPYQIDIPEEYKGVDRWFLLDTDLDSPRPWKLTTELPVFSLALVMGQAPDRQWLVYAHAPLGLRQNVQIKIPDYTSIKVNVPVGGAFYLVHEKSGGVETVRTS